MHRIAHMSSYAAAALLGVGLAATAAAQDGGASALSGTIVGDRGGAYQTWSVSLPASTDVALTLSHWPCDAGGAVGLNVWGSTGRLAMSSAADACTQKAAFNTGAGGMAEIQLYDYLHGVGTWWSLTADGISLGSGPAAAAPAAPAAPAAAMAAAPAAAAPAAATTVPATSSTAVSAPAAPAAGSAQLNVTDTVFGDSAGSFDNHNLAVVEGQTYKVRMTVGTDWGGNWPGVGFDVWGPGGRITRASWVAHNILEATFTASGNVVVLVQPYNYHHGMTVFYTLETVPGV